MVVLLTSTFGTEDSHYKKEKILNVAYYLSYSTHVEGVDDYIFGNIN